MKLAVYVLCFDDESEAAASEAFAPYEWAIVTRLPDDDPALGKYMEGYAYLRTLRDNRAEWRDADLVGVLSWRASLKIHVDLLAKACEDSRGADVVAFMPSSDNMLEQAARHHPRFLQVWVPLLLHLGHDARAIVRDDMPTFFCNYWLASPGWMDRFLDFYAAVRTALEELPSIQDALWSDPGYVSGLSGERCMRVYGRPYIPYHPFVCERLPCFFFHNEGARISMVPLTDERFWKTVKTTRDDP